MNNLTLIRYIIVATVISLSHSYNLRNLNNDMTGTNDPYDYPYNDTNDDPYFANSNY